MSGSKKSRRNHQVQTRHTSVMSAARYEARSGPIPSPTDLEHYERVHSGLADRIMKMAEGQSHHRQELEREVITGGIKAQNRGQIFGFIIGMTVILSGSVLIYFDKNAEGLTAIIAALVALLGVFIFGKKKQSKELAEKAD